MSSFPIFLELSGAAPLVAGGGELAAAKVRLLLKRSRRVAVAADRVVPELADLLAKGVIERVERAVALEDIRGRPLVIAATEDEAEDARISRLARSLGVPVNVPDRPELCSFILGAVVDRGAVTIAIGTEGAAPVLATRLRSFLERELHPRLGRLAEIAAEYRDAVARRLPPGAARRVFWERIFGGPAGEAILDGREEDGRKLIGAVLDGSEIERRGRVVLVGAGPGDPDLLTLKAVRALKSADVILYDNLVGAGVLDHARREATLVCVGKRKGRHSRSQAEINALMVALAHEGKTVVRLKGGDPFIFGRGGEEVETLRASGIAVEVVPGITAATAAAASLQVPLTHRELSHSVTFISGHAADDGEPDFGQVDLSALAGGHATLGVYMGVSTAQALGQKLLGSGWSPATPVLAVERAANPGERRVATSLDVLACEPQRLELAGPAVLLIGEVAGLDAAGDIERVAARVGVCGTVRAEAALA